MPRLVQSVGEELEIGPRAEPGSTSRSRRPRSRRRWRRRAGGAPSSGGGSDPAARTGSRAVRPHPSTCRRTGRRTRRSRPSRALEPGRVDLALACRGHAATGRRAMAASPRPREHSREQRIDIGDVAVQRDPAARAGPASSAGPEPRAGVDVARRSTRWGHVTPTSSTGDDVARRPTDAELVACRRHGTHAVRRGPSGDRRRGRARWSTRCEEPAGAATLAKPTRCCAGSSRGASPRVEKVGVHLHHLDGVAVAGVGDTVHSTWTRRWRRRRRCRRSRNRGRSRTGTAARGRRCRTSVADQPTLEVVGDTVAAGVVLERRACPPAGTGTSPAGDPAARQPRTAGRRVRCPSPGRGTSTRARRARRRATAW